ncbi:MAG: hypothetical protein AAFW84_08010 [Cyanobacteria bacterium J06635_15]
MTASTVASDKTTGMLSKSWLQQSVRQCFASYNWEGRAQPEALVGSDPIVSGEALPPLSFQLSVQQFFSQFPWEGTPEIAVPVSPLGVKAATEEADDLTLDAFSDLF